MEGLLYGRLALLMLYALGKEGLGWSNSMNTYMSCVCSVKCTPDSWWELNWGSRVGTTVLSLTGHERGEGGLADVVKTVE